MGKLGDTVKPLVDISKPVLLHSTKHKLGVAYHEDGDPYKFWLLRHNGTLEAWNAASAYLSQKEEKIYGWDGSPMSLTANQIGMPSVKKDTPTFEPNISSAGCKISDEKTTIQVKFDDYNQLNKVTLTEVYVTAPDATIKQMLQFAKAVLPEIQRRTSAAQVEIWFYPHETVPHSENSAARRLYLAYTRDPSKLVFRDKIWTVFDYSKKQDMEKITPDASCSVGKRSLNTVDALYKEAEKAVARKDYPTALRLLTSLANQGDAKGLRGLGRMYLYGYGVSKDYTKAVNLFKKSAGQGDAGGQNGLGAMYATGRGGMPRNYAKALGSVDI